MEPKAIGVSGLHRPQYDEARQAVREFEALKEALAHTEDGYVPVRVSGHEINLVDPQEIRTQAETDWRGRIRIRGQAIQRRHYTVTGVTESPIGFLDGRLVDLSGRIASKATVDMKFSERDGILTKAYTVQYKSGGPLRSLVGWWDEKDVRRYEIRVDMKTGQPVHAEERERSNTFGLKHHHEIEQRYDDHGFLSDTVRTGDPP